MRKWGTRGSEWVSNFPKITLKPCLTLNCSNIYNNTKIFESAENALRSLPIFSFLPYPALFFIFFGTHGKEQTGLVNYSMDGWG